MSKQGSKLVIKEAFQYLLSKSKKVQYYNILKLEIPGLENVKTEEEDVPERQKEGYLNKKQTARLCSEK